MTKEALVALFDLPEDTTDNDIIVEIPKPSNKEKSIPSNPLEDRFGRGRWVRTRLCFCLPDNKSPCQLVKRETCPSEKLDKSQRTIGQWLWATNPEFEKVIKKEEAEESSKDEIKIG